MSSIWTIRRSATDAKLAGLCGGVATHWGVDPLLVRVGWVLLALSGGIGLVLYLAGWLLIPVEGRDRAPADDLFGESVRRWPKELWITLVVIASLAMFTIFGWLSPFSIGPAIVIAVIWYFGFYKGRHDKRTSTAQISTADTSSRPEKPAQPQFLQFIQYAGPPSPFTEAAVAWQRRIEDHTREVAAADYSAATPPEVWPSPPPASLSQQPSSGPLTGLPRPSSDPPAPEHTAFLAEPDPVGLYVEPPASVPAKLSDTHSAKRLRLISLIVLGLTLSGLGIAQALGIAIPVAGYLAAALLVIGLTLVAATYIGLAQINCTVGDIDGNLLRLREARARAAGFDADLVMFSELFLSGYPPEDLVLKPAFLEACQAACERVAEETRDGGPAVLVGLPWAKDGHCYNAYALLAQGRIEALRFKVDLPNYGVFDEKRVFTPGPMPGPIVFKGVRIGIPICEDIWGPDPIECIGETGGEILLVPNGSPYWRGKTDERLSVAVARVVESKLPLVYLNQFGGQDELVFDGASFGLDADSSLAFQLPAFSAVVARTVWERGTNGFVCVEGPKAALEEGDAADYAACVLGLRDYVNKNGFPGVVMGLSGGIDSALCAAIAVDALGPDRVHCLMLPYRFTSAQSLADAAGCAAALGVRYDVLPIAPVVEGFETVLAPLFAGLAPGTAEENIQSRARGALLMAVSNKFGPMLVTTGNKSEMSVGYATIYGDMNGGFNPIKDIYKTEVFRLAELRNRWRPAGALGPSTRVIPADILTKPPSAELRENQTDQDSLPPYEVLDAILDGLVEKEIAVADLVAAGHDFTTVKRIEKLLYLAEYKRRQSAPGVKVTGRNFGRDRRYPIVNLFRDVGARAASSTQSPK